MASSVAAGLDVVAFDLGVECGGVKAEQPGRAGLVSAGLIKGPADQVDLESFDLVVEVYSPGYIDTCRCAFALGYHLESEFRVADLGTQALGGEVTVWSDHARALDDILEFTNVAGIVVVLEKRQDVGSDIHR